jgi:hypothetical protein
MKKKREREPDLIEFKVNYTLDGDIPVEKYFMAYSANEAIKSFAHSCVKFLSEKKFSDIEMSCFTNAFTSPTEPYLTKPNENALPKPIPALDEAELVKFEEIKKEELLTEQALSNPESEEANSPLGTAEEIDIFTPPVKVEKVDPRVEHAERLALYSKKVNAITAENKKILESYESLIFKTNQRITEINQRINIIEISEYFKWSDKWIDVPIPTYSNLV